MKNLCAKTVKREDAYEVWQTPNGAWTWYVLKKYKAQDAEAKDPYARWFCCVTSPAVGEQGELGDVYAADVKDAARLIKQRMDAIPQVSIIPQRAAAVDEHSDAFAAGMMSRSGRER